MRHLAIAVMTLAACATTPSDREVSEIKIDPRLDDARTAELEASIKVAGSGITDPMLASLLRSHWTWHLRERPRFATSLGIRDYDDRLERTGFEAMKKRDDTLNSFLALAQGIAPQSLTPADRTTRKLFITSIQDALLRRQCRFEEWNVSAHSNALENYGELGDDFFVRGDREPGDLLRRYREVAAQIDGEVYMLGHGLEDGLVGNAESMRRVVEMLDAQLEQPVETWPLLSVVAEFPDVANREASIKALTEIVQSQIAPALVRYRDFVRDELLPKARPDGDVGLVALPLGEQCYEAMVQHYTTLPLTPEEVHEVGLREIERIDAEIAALGRKALGTSTLAETLQRLRTDRTLYFETSKQVETAATEALALAKAKIPEYFGRLPQADCVVEVVPDYKAPFTTIAYYDGPHADGSKPGEYFVNVFEPQTRPRFEARVLAVHESIPGHHLQIAIAQELGELPAFRRHQGYTAFVEGWALYTERLADEMGMYDGELDRLGMLSFDAWRAGRLVVDTGIHALGWSRQDAVDYLTEHTALTPGNIDNEVDRYISWPGQALGYKIGQLEIWKLRRQAEQQLGERFHLPAFHDVVLEGGAVTLPVLQEQVAGYIAASE